MHLRNVPSFFPSFQLHRQRLCRFPLLARQMPDNLISRASARDSVGTTSSPFVQNSQVRQP